MRVLGTTEMKCCQIVVDDCQLPCTAQEFHTRYSKLGSELLGDCDLMPGRKGDTECLLLFFVLADCSVSHYSALSLIRSSAVAFNSTNVLLFV